jgi:hypothetical protein
MARKSSNPRQVVPCSVNYDSQCLQGRHLADVGLVEIILILPKSTFAPAIGDVGRYPAFSETDLRSISYANAFRLYPELAKRIR